MNKAKEKAREFSQKLAFSSHAEMLLAEDAFIAGFKAGATTGSDYAEFAGARACLLGISEHIKNKIVEFEHELERMKEEQNDNKR